MVRAILGVEQILCVLQGLEPLYGESRMVPYSGSVGKRRVIIGRQTGAEGRKAGRPCLAKQD